MCDVIFILPSKIGPAKFQIEDVRNALSLCTHLIYGYAHINSDFEVVPGSPNLDTGSGYAYYRLATQLKRSFPDLKVYLSVGGNSDPYDEEHKYLVLVGLRHCDFINFVQF